jgi:hypothetical protein
MQLQKTNKARAELQNGNRTLGQRERSILILANGTNTIQTIESLFNGEGRQIARQLIDSGYLEVAAPPLPPKQPPEDLDLSNADTGANAALKIKKPAQAEPQAQTPPLVSADNFEGKRSLATTRMFLFDICERMFVQRNRAQADFFREALRNARDRESMLEVSRAMITAIEEIAGHERADSISERIAMLLPPEE